MARTGLTKAQVRVVRDQLRADGIYPSADAVRRALGDTGSKSTIHRYLKELDEEGTAGGNARDETAGALHALVEQLADRLYADHAQALRAKDAELAELRAAVASLSARLAQLEGHPAAPSPARWSPEPKTARSDQAISGFGNFSFPLSNSRGSHGDVSAFSMVRAGGRSDVFDMDSVLPAGPKLL